MPLWLDLAIAALVCAGAIVVELALIVAAELLRRPHPALDRPETLP